MEVFIIYAALAINGLVTFVEFKGAEFKTMEQCTGYFEEYNDAIVLSLNEHIQTSYPGYTVAYSGCSTRKHFIEKST